MSDPMVGVAAFVALIIAIQAGMHVPIALMLVAAAGITALVGGEVGVAVDLLGMTVTEGLSNYVYGVIPLFVLMGYLVNTSDLGRESFDVAHRLLGRRRGGLGIATVLSNAVFAAITGISIASAAVFTKIATPQMLRLGHRARFAVGVVAGSSILGMLIPPSLLLVLYGIVAEQSIADLFLAGLLPGLLLAFAFVVAIVAMDRFWPSFVYAAADRVEARAVPGEPHATPEAPLPAGQLLARVAPIALLIVLVLGGIYGGFFTPTEAGAVGALGALVIGLVKRRLDGPRLWSVLVQTGHTTASIGMLLIGATLFAKMIALSQLPGVLGALLEDSGLGLYATLALYVAVLLVLGTILDAGSIILITLPIVLPAMLAFGADPIWFGVVTIIAVEIGLLTPPLGMACFVIRSALDDDRISLGEVFIGAAPFAGVMLIVLALVVAFPWLALALL